MPHFFVTARSIAGASCWRSRRGGVSAAFFRFFNCHHHFLNGRIKNSVASLKESISAFDVTGAPNVLSKISLSRVLSGAENAALVVNTQLLKDAMSVNPDGASRIVSDRLADSFVDHSPAFGAPLTKAGFDATVRFINSAFHQVYHVDRMIEQGDTVVAIWHADTEHVGQFLHLPASGKRFLVRGITAYSLSDGKVTVHWKQFDQLAILTALGVVPPTGG